MCIRDRYLNNNECIGIPTETVYGLAANAYSDRSTKKIFKLKGRPGDNPLIVHYYNISPKVYNIKSLRDVPPAQ